MKKLYSLISYENTNTYHLFEYKFDSLLRQCLIVNNISECQSIRFQNTSAILFKCLTKEETREKIAKIANTYPDLKICGRCVSTLYHNEN